MTTTCDLKELKMFKIIGKQMFESISKQFVIPFFII